MQSPSAPHSSRAMRSAALIAAASAALLAGAAAGASPAQASGGGTGFVVSRAGHVLTNYHIVKACIGPTTEFNGQAVRFSIIAADPDNDLALMQADRPLQTKHVAVFRADQPALRPGDDLVAVGFPLRGILASEPNVTTGTVSAMAGPSDDPRLLQLSVPIQAGSSGSPVLDSAALVIGIVTVKLDALAIARAIGDVPQNVNFAIKTEVVRGFLERSGFRVPIADPQRRLHAADVGEIARAYTVFVDCGEGGDALASYGGAGGALPAPRVASPGRGTGQQVPNLTGNVPVTIQTRPPTAGTAEPPASLALAETDGGDASSQADRLAPSVAVAPAGSAPSRLTSNGGRGLKPESGWQIQIGAYSTFLLAQDAAKLAAERIPGLPAGADLVVVPLERDRGTLYRARIAGLSKQKAEDACRSLHRANTECYLLPAHAP